MGSEVEELEPVAGAEDVEEVEAERPEPDDTEESTDEVTVSIGDEEPAEKEEEQPAPEWVRELRKSNREKDRRIRELEQKQATAAPQPVSVGAKPKLEDCDYDTAKFETELEAWHERKRVVDVEEGKKRAAAETEQKAWAARLDHHKKLVSELKVKDFDDAEAAMETTFSVTQRGLIVHGAENSAVMFYALAKNPKKAKEFASITDPVKFAFAVAKLETQLKVTPRKQAPIPERQVSGSASLQTGDKQLEKLRAEADRTGDRTKVVAYMRDKKAKAAGR